MYDLTKGSPIKAIIRFAIPLLIGSIFQTAYNFADSIIVGHILGEIPFAAIGTTGSIIFFILGFAQGVTNGFSVILAQKYGAKDLGMIKRSFFTGLTLSVMIGFILSSIALIFLYPFLQIMHTPPTLIELSYQFLSIIFLGSIPTILYNYLSNTIRSTGDSRTPLVALTIAVLLNIGLDLIFIAIFQLGVNGAALATVCSQIFSVCFLGVYIYLKLPYLQLSKKDLYLKKEEVKKHLSIGLPMGFQASIIAIGTMTLQFSLNQIGTTAVAAQAIASKTDQLAMLPMVSLGMSVSTFVAQNYGAKAYRRIFDGTKKALFINITWALFFAFCLLVGHQIFASLFLPQGSVEIYQLTFTYYVINGSCYWILAILFTLRGFIQGLGKSFAPTLAGVMELIMRVGVAWFGLSTFSFEKVVVANPAAWIGSILILIPATISVYRQLKVK